MCLKLFSPSHRSEHREHWERREQAARGPEAPALTTVVLGCTLFLSCWLGRGRQGLVALICMHFRSFDIMMGCMLTVPVSQVGVVRRLLVLLGLVIFRGFMEMVGRFLVMTSGVMVMLPSL